MHQILRTGVGTASIFSIKKKKKMKCICGGDLTHYQCVWFHTSVASQRR